MTAEYQVHDAIAVITLNNPPVNGLGLSTRSALVASMKKALADDAVKAVIITGAGKVFSGGADIKEFNSPTALAEPSLHTVIDVVENSSKPVIAAIHSVCMGGGLELSLACNYRVAAPGAQIALPEVKLGLLPGAGGTQRLRRIKIFRKLPNCWQYLKDRLTNNRKIAAMLHCRPIGQIRWK